MLQRPKDRCNSITPTHPLVLSASSRQQLEIGDRDHSHKRLAVPSDDNPFAPLNTIEEFTEVATGVGNGDGRSHTLIFGKDGNSFIRADP